MPGQVATAPLTQALLCVPMPGQVRCLNEQVSGSWRNVLKPWHLRLQPTAEPLRSHEDDTELLLHIP